MSIEGPPKASDNEIEKKPYEKPAVVRTEQIPDKDQEALESVTKQNIGELADSIESFSHDLNGRDQEGYNALFESGEKASISIAGSRLRESLGAGKLDPEEIREAANLMRVALEHMGEASQGEMPNDDEENLGRTHSSLMRTWEQANELGKRLGKLGENFNDARSAVTSLASKIEDCESYLRRKRAAIMAYNMNRY